MKSCIFKDKVIRKFYYWEKLATKPIVTGKKDKKIILPGLGPEKVENHCSTPVFLNPCAVTHKCAVEFF